MKIIKPKRVRESVGASFTDNLGIHFINYS